MGNLLELTLLLLTEADLAYPRTSDGRFKMQRLGDGFCETHTGEPFQARLDRYMLKHCRRSGIFIPESVLILDALKAAAQWLQEFIGGSQESR